MVSPETNSKSPSFPSLEVVELELALQLQDPVEQGFEECVRHALDAVGGELLFHLRVENMPGLQRLAAVSIGSGDDRQLALVVLPSDGGSLRIETDQANASAFAGLAASYAGLMDRLAA